LKFKFICNLQNRFEKEKNFLIGNWLRAKFGMAQPATARAAYAAQPTAPRPGGSWARNPRGEAEPDPLSKSDLIGG
jgi:hypothetical protein